MLKKFEVGPQAYRDAMSHFAGAVHVVTTDGVAGKRGATVIAACSVSDTPPMVLVCVNRDNPKNDAFVKNGNFALNTLAARHEPLAVAFSGVTGLAPEAAIRARRMGGACVRRAGADRRGRRLRLRTDRYQGTGHPSRACLAR